MACEKEEHLVNKNNEQLPQNPKDMVQNKFIFQWDTLIDDSSEYRKRLVIFIFFIYFIFLRKKGNNIGSIRCFNFLSNIGLVSMKICFASK